MPTLEIAQKKLDLARKAEEYYNALRTNIQLSGNNLKVISITSVKPGEQLLPILLGLSRVRAIRHC